MTNYDLQLEMRIVISFITNTAFCKRVFPIYDPEYLTNDFAKKVVGWCKVYFDKYRTAPNTNIESIYYEKIESLEEADQEIIGSILENLSQTSENQEDHDTKYDVDLAVKCFQKRKLQLTGDTISHLASIDSLEEALELQRDYKEITIDNEEQPSFYDPAYAIDFLNNMNASEDPSRDTLYLDGRLGDFIGPLEEGWLISIMAPPKRGKSWFLQEVAMSAVRSRIKTVFISLEMPVKDMGKRFVQAIAACPKRISNTIKIIPIFDCASNQNGKCGLKQRPKQEAIKILDDEKKDPILTFERYKKHVPCTACRGQLNYKPASWFKKISEITSKNKIFSQCGAWRPQFESFLRTRAYSASTTKLVEIINYLERLKESGFLPKILVIDYADLIAADDSRKDYRFQLDQIWKGLKSIAKDFGMLVITASQSNREGMRSTELESVHAAEDIKKINISDLFLGVNQTKEEKAKGIMRLGFLDARHDTQSRFCYILQDLAHGQFCLDSEF